ncbi:type VI secretion system protein TssA [Vibrio sp. JC009]|uniref:type VI secretion system protein TssA n=1 Tax=Vibrio sp. JC009 TaxID=2912314 RepID=UPI0023AFE93C|nr:type VI secretion system protein TssA [Vibrio sp. JC009]WED22952.1 type VI secretion system protein TssA [Vibrio sp. JC009]
MAAIDRESLCNAISADQPCGEDLEYDNEFIEIENLSQGKAEQQIGDTVVEAEEADWQLIKKKSIALLSRTKDIRVFIFLIRAVLNSDDLTKFNDVLAALKESITSFWPDIYPLLDEDDGDPTMRINALVTLCDEQAVLLPLRKAPLVKSRMLGSFSLRDINYATGVSSPPSGYDLVAESTINGAFQDADTDELQATHDAITESIESISEIEGFVTDQVGVGNAASFSALSGELKEIQKTLGNYLQLRGVAPQTESADDNVPANDTTAAASGSATAPVSQQVQNLSGDISSREDVINALEKIERYYNQYEPTSPIPLLIGRAKKMVNMNFMEIMKNIAPDGLPQVEVIRGPEQEEQSVSQPDEANASSSTDDDW